MLRKLCPYITLFALLPIGHGEIWVSSSPPHPITARVFFDVHHPLYTNYSASGGQFDYIYELW